MTSFGLLGISSESPPSLMALSSQPFGKVPGATEAHESQHANNEPGGPGQLVVEGWL